MQQLRLFCMDARLMAVDPVTLSSSIMCSIYLATSLQPWVLQ